MLNSKGNSKRISMKGSRSKLGTAFKMCTELQNDEKQISFQRWHKKFHDRWKNETVETDQLEENICIHDSSLIF